jgi:aminopeptidase N
MLVTQFEVADARRMFPGWDEPAFKATFRLGVTLPKDYVPVGNMPVVSTTPAGANAKRVVFAATPRMSTYLLALVAGDMSALHGTGGGTPINAYAPTGEQVNGAYALHAATEILPFYNEYFGVPYPLPKLDLVAIPGNYEAGAMENWGDITFIDNALLFDAKTSGPRTRETIYLDVAHEMAHQWSGDLVTMGWWDNIWLNEGFATWMETKAADHFNPTWQIWPRAHADRELAMAVDALPTTHPIQQTIADVSAANAAFDLISYQKGEQVIRMVEDWLGPDVFRDGMRVYMKAHAYGNTTSADLWAALSQVSHKDVAPVATSFTEQPGIPLVSVARSCTGGATNLTLSQSRFTIHDPDPKPLTWRIPVTVGGPSVVTQTVLLTNAPITLHFAGCGVALKANLGEAGYYRAHYDDASLSALKGAFPTLSATDRVNLLGDQFALFEAGTSPLAGYLDIAATLSDGKDQSVAVWQDTIAHLQRLDVLMRGSPSRAAFRAFARSLLAPQFTRLGWEPRAGESFLDTLLRPTLIAALGRFDDPAVVMEAQRRFSGYLKDASSLPASLLDPVMLLVGMHADDATTRILEHRLRAAPDTEEKIRYFTALAGSRDPARIANTVRLA